MSHAINKHDATKAVVTEPGNGIMFAIADTTTDAGTVGYGPGCVLTTRTTNKLYINTGTLAAATWTVVGSQS